MIGRVLGFVLALSACDFALGIDYLDTRDASNDRLDGPSPPVDGAHSGGWTTPVLVFAAQDDDDPTLTGDMLEIYFNRGDDIWWATRPDPQAVWPEPTVNSQLSSPSADTSPKISRDGLTMFFASERTGTAGSEDVWMAKRANRSSPWMGISRIAELDTQYVDSAASPSLDLKELVMHSKRMDGSHYDLYRSTRGSLTSVWSMPAPIDELNTPRESSNPVLTDDGLTIYFDSNRNNAATQSDLYIAHRPTPNDPFEPATPLAEINGVKDDRDPWISPDEKTLVFSSDRGGTLGIYVTSSH